MSLAVHSKAHHLYAITQTYLAGIVLTGAEVKSLRRGAASLVGSFVKPLAGELYLINAQITPYAAANNDKYDPRANRKLLMRKKEIYRLLESVQVKGMSLIPLSFELINNHIKLKIGLGKGKKEYEKRQTLKDRAIDRSLARRVKQQYNA